MQQHPNNLSPWQVWSHDVQMKLKIQQEQILSLEQRLAAVCEQLKQLETKPAYNIENLQYHFDQLKVEKLEGTLNIGMTPPGSPSIAGDIEQMSVSKPEVYPSAASGITPPPNPYSDIQYELDHYLNTHGPQRLMDLEAELGQPLDPYHRRMIIEYIRKQMPARINYYMQSIINGNNNNSPSPVTAQKNRADVITKSASDADSAMMQYISQLKDNSSATDNGG